MASWQLDLPRPIVIAHRGGAGLYPENTLAAFLAAYHQHGVRFMELDVQFSREGIPVVVHDATLDRTTNDQGPVNQQTLADLQALDAGCRFTGPDGQNWGGRGVQIPTLAAVLEALPDCWFSVEVKTANPTGEQAVVELIQRLGLVERVILSSDDHRIAKRLAALSPASPRFYNCRDFTRLWWGCRWGLSRWIRPRHHTLQIPEWHGHVYLITPALLAWARRWGLPVLVWTVNDPADMRRLLEMGVDGLITDRPDLAQANAGAWGMASQP